MKDNIRLTLILAVAALLAQGHAFGAVDDRPMLLPTPKKVEWLGGSVKLSSAEKPFACIVAGRDKAIATGVKQLNDRLTELGAKPLPVLEDAAEAKSYDAAIRVGAGGSVSGDAARPDGYHLTCMSVAKQTLIACSGFDSRGCYYGLQTLIQLMSADAGTVTIPRVSIIDWPTFRLRLVKTAPCGTPPEMVARWVDLMPRYKASVLAAQFQPKADTGTWREPSELFVANAQTVGHTARDLGTCDAFIYYGPFGRDRGSLTDPKVIDDYVAKLDYWISQGYSWIAVDFNDWFQTRHQTQEEREKIGGLADCWIFLANEAYKRVRAKHPDVGFATCLSAGYYKDASPEVIKFCKSVPEDILVVSVGPKTSAEDYCTPISAEFLKDWAAKTGRKPFYWDNCLYRQLDQYAPFINRIYNLDSYANRFPPNMADLVAGPGIHLNGGVKEWWEPGVLTFLDYTWNPEAYNAEESLRKARVMLWGEAAASAAAEAQKTLAGFYAYLHDVHADPTKADRVEADQRFDAVQKAVDKLKAALPGARIRQELDEQCLATAKQKMNQAFAPAQPAKPAGIATPTGGAE
jgi:hypothetical protein